MEKLKSSLRKFKRPVVASLIALAVLLLVISNPPFYQIGEFKQSTKAKGEEAAENVTASADASDSEAISHKPTRPEADKLLGGLLVPGFDEEPCLSRYQSSLYRKASPHKPSSYLLSKLRKYEDRHRRCGPHTELYNKSVNELNSGHSSSFPDCKYIVWLAYNGLGNRIISIVSAFLYALFTDRVLLLSHETDMADLFCEPFPNTSWLLPMGFPLRNQFHNFDFENAHTFGSMVRKYAGKNTPVKPLPFLFLNLSYNYEEEDKHFYMDHNQGFLHQVPWLILKSDQYFVPSLFQMTSFNKEFLMLFKNIEAVFHHLGRYLFHPSNQPWGLITRFYEAYLAKADERIGLQIRLFHPKSNPSDLIMKQILNCTRQEKLLPQLDEYKHASSPSSRRYKTSKAVLVASLHSEYYEHLRHLYWMKPTVNGEVVGVYQPSHEEYQHFGDNMHNMKAWAEMYILSFSDVLVTSSWSTFGYVAQGLGGLKPWMLYFPDPNQKSDKPDSPCQRATSMEPCFHFPPSYDREADVIHNTSSRSPFIRHCEDVSWGLKLVDKHYYELDL